MEYEHRDGEGAALNSVSPRAAPTRHGGPAAIQVAHAGEWAATVLARPLFSPSRRPPAHAANPVAATASLPRLTAVLITDAGRRALFENAGGRPIVVTVGGRIGSYRVRSIAAGMVVLSGPDGETRLAPHFAAGNAGGQPGGGLPGGTGPVAPPAQPSILDLLRGVKPNLAIQGLPAPPAGRP